jgi:outer membrane protein assembly factor BamA
MSQSLRNYGDGGVFHREKRTVQRTFPRTHLKTPPKKTDYSNPKDLLKLGMKTAAAYVGMPNSYAAVPITSLFSDFGMAGEERLNPNRAAQLKGFKNKKDQDLRVKQTLEGRYIFPQPPRRLGIGK